MVYNHQTIKGIKLKNFIKLSVFDMVILLHGHEQVG